MRLVPQLFTAAAPPLWARSHPDLHQAAIDVDRLDPCCDGRAGYLIELFYGHYAARHPAMDNELPAIRLQP